LGCIELALKRIEILVNAVMNVFLRTENCDECHWYDIGRGLYLCL
jgi:hypothetical protein